MLWVQPVATMQLRVMTDRNEAKRTAERAVGRSSPYAIPHLDNLGRYPNITNQTSQAPRDPGKWSCIADTDYQLHDISIINDKHRNVKR